MCSDKLCDSTRSKRDFFTDFCFLFAQTRSLHCKVYQHSFRLATTRLKRSIAQLLRLYYYIYIYLEAHLLFIQTVDNTVAVPVEKYPCLLEHCQTRTKRGCAHVTAWLIAELSARTVKMRRGVLLLFLYIHLIDLYVWIKTKLKKTCSAWNTNKLYFPL